MKNNQFRGWVDVFRFTFVQTTKKTSLRLVTALIALGIIIAIFGVNIFRAVTGDEIEPSPIEKVLVIDQSGLVATDYHSLIVAMENEKFKDVEFESVNGKGKEDVVKEISDVSTKAVVANIRTQDDGYILEIILPDRTEISNSEGEDLADVMTTCFESNKLMQVGLSNEQLTMALSPVIISTADIGEDNSDAAIILRMIIPMVFGLVLYFMLLFHGQTITQEVSTEKTSKLMETLLTTVHPYALITGKVLAIALVAIIQLIIWVVAILIGLFGGNAIAQVMNPDYSNSIVEMINFVRDSLGQTAMTPSAIVLAIIILCVGFLFYCVLSGLFGCMVTKPDDAASIQGVSQFPMIISWLVTYLGVAMDNRAVLSVARYIPFTAPFCVPVDLLTGRMGIVEGVISAAILIVFSMIVIMVAARIYKGLVLYNGQKLSFKKIINIVRNNTN